MSRASPRTSEARLIVRSNKKARHVGEAVLKLETLTFRKEGNRSAKQPLKQRRLSDSSTAAEEKFDPFMKI